jgi:hypothetical protein
LRLAAGVAVTLLVLAGLYQEQRRLHRNDLPDPPELSWAVAAVRAATAPGATVVSDQPIVPFRARRAQPGPLVDTSNTRIAGGGLTAAEVVAEIERAQPDAVLVARMLRTLPAVLEHLDARYPRRVRCGDVTLYLPAGAPPVPPCPP